MLGMHLGTNTYRRIGEDASKNLKDASSLCFLSKKVLGYNDNNCFSVKRKIMRYLSIKNVTSHIMLNRGKSIFFFFVLLIPSSLMTLLI